jgi:hypothetical protein
MLRQSACSTKRLSLDAHELTKHPDESHLPRSTTHPPLALPRCALAQRITSNPRRGAKEQCGYAMSLFWPPAQHKQTIQHLTKSAFLTSAITVSATVIGQPPASAQIVERIQPRHTAALLRRSNPHLQLRHIFENSFETGRDHRSNMDPW